VRSGLYKVEGSGNDFLLGIGYWAERLAAEPDLARRLCDRRRGIGADGTLALSADSDRHARVGYRNADGGAAGFCANGTRCAARAAVELLGCRTTLAVTTGWGDIPAVVKGSDVSLELPPPVTPPARPAIATHPPVTDILHLELGVPHLVAAASGALFDLDLGVLAPPLRAHPALGPEGANVNFFQPADDGSVAVRSWERGVEGETLSCGSGLVAVALVVMAERRTREVTVRPASGDLLRVEAIGDPPSGATRLTGPARFIAEVHPSDEVLADL
jgi:diaminopimelate epimerase